MAATVPAEEKFKALEDELKAAELQKKIKEAKDWSYWQEEQLIRAKGEGGGFTDVFKQQESFNTTILDVLKSIGGGSGSGAPTYIMATPSNQQQEEGQKSPNYIFWVAIAGLALFFFLRKRR